MSSGANAPRKGLHELGSDASIPLALPASPGLGSLHRQGDPRVIPRPAPSSWMATGLLLLVAVTADAQTGGRMYRLGVLANAFEVSEGPLFEEFLEGLRKQGFVEGRNLVVEWRSSEGRFDRLPALATELLRAEDG